jgi:hypothetical protein
MIDCSVLCLAPAALPGNGGRGDVDPVAEYYRVSMSRDKFQISLNHSYSHDIVCCSHLVLILHYRPFSSKT